MPYDLTKRLVVGLSSSALFDLTDSDDIFRTKGEDIYCEYQRDQQDIPLEKWCSMPIYQTSTKIE